MFVFEKNNTKNLASYPGGKFVNIAPAPVMSKLNQQRTQTIQRVDAQGRTVQQVVRLMQVKFRILLEFYRNLEIAILTEDSYVPKLLTMKVSKFLNTEIFVIRIRVIIYF